MGIPLVVQRGLDNIVPSEKPSACSECDESDSNSLIPARAFFFIIVDEFGKDGFLVRRAYTSLNNPYLTSKGLNELGNLSAVFPEKYGMMPTEWPSTTTIAEHVMGGSKGKLPPPSPYISTSSIFPEGSPRMVGNSVYIDIVKAKAAGLKLVSTEEILKDLARYKQELPRLGQRIDRIAHYVGEVDKEVLIHGERVPASAIFTKDTLAKSNGIVRTARVVQVLGIVLTAYDLEKAGEKSIQIKSIKPISAEVVRQAGGWGGAIAGAKLGGAIGTAVGIESGPGALVTGAIGGIIGGVAGYFGADWIADYIYEN
jgi:hypothetical protein